MRDPKNRNRYLDDLVWLIHDRFNIVCSTTTMSKLKRKWMHVLEAEESGEPLDEAARAQVMETHPNEPILQRTGVPQASMIQSTQAPTEEQQAESEQSGPAPQPSHYSLPHHDPSQQRQQQHHPHHGYEAQMDARLLQAQHQADTRLHASAYPMPQTDPKMQTPYFAVASYPLTEQHTSPQHFDPQLQRELASHAIQRM